jgi:hypothetical protein
MSSSPVPQKKKEREKEREREREKRKEGRKEGRKKGRKGERERKKLCGGFSPYVIFNIQICYWLY